MHDARIGPRPLRVMFVHTSLTVGGEEMLLAEIVRRLDRDRFAPEVCCLKERGPLGDQLARRVPVFENLLGHKCDLRVWGRTARLMRDRAVDAVVTVGTGGDKMFWGRLAAWRAGVPVIVSALHATGWPLKVEWLNRRLEPLTDAFIALAENHARHISEREGCPAGKIHVIPNGVDAQRFRPRNPEASLQRELGIDAETPVVGIVAELRPEKNHGRFLRVAAGVRRQLPQTRFLIVGDGPERDRLERLAEELGLRECVRFTGRRSDVPELLSICRAFLLTSDMEASPVSILEAMAAGRPVVSTRVGSIPEVVVEGETGYLVDPQEEPTMIDRVVALLAEPGRAAEMGRAARRRVLEKYSVERMVEGYADLLLDLAAGKSGRENEGASRTAAAPTAHPAGAGA